MGKKLVIAEKPSVGTEIAKVLHCSERKDGFMEGASYIVTWAVGHLVGLKYPEEHNKEFEKWNLKDLPLSFPVSESLKVLPNTKKQFEVIKQLIHRSDVDSIINAGDSGREGLLIQEWIYRMAGNKKPIKVLWIDSQTEEAIQNGFQNLKENQLFETLLQEAEARAEGDNLLGINYSRLLTLTKAAPGTVLSYGRCQTPLENLVVKRDYEIAEFEPSPYYDLEIMYQKGFTGTLVDVEKKKISFTEKNKVEQLVKELHPHPAIVKSYITTQKSQKAPQLFNLAALQKAMGTKYEYTPDYTLSVAQSLYEKHKILSYPRTDSRCLSDDLFNVILEHIQCCDFNKYSSFVSKIDKASIQKDKKYFNNHKVTDHHALIPTINKNMASIYSSLTTEEKNVFDSVLERFLAIFLPEYKYDSTEIITAINDTLFLSRGTTIRSLGYKEILSSEEVEKEPEEDTKKQLLPFLEEGSQLSIDKLSILEEKTKPPARYTISSLIELMEKYHIGTSATRAEIIKKLLNPKRAYMVLDKGKYYSTKLGREYISIVPDDLKDPLLTEKFETKLKLINDGSLSKEEFLQELEKDLNENIKRFSNLSETGERIAREVISVGKCPLCKNDVNESLKAFNCSNQKNGCSFMLWKVIAGKTITTNQATQLLSKGQTAKLKGFTGKNGSFEAALLLKDGKVTFKF